MREKSKKLRDTVVKATSGIKSAFSAVAAKLIRRKTEKDGKKSENEEV